MYEMCVIQIMDYSATSTDLNACTKLHHALIPWCPQIHLNYCIQGYSAHCKKKIAYAQVTE